MTAMSLDYRLNHMTSRFSAARRTVMSLKLFVKVHPVLKQPHGRHQDFPRPYKQAVLLEWSVSEMEGDMRRHCSCSTCFAFPTCLDSVACFVLKQSF